MESVKKNKLLLADDAGILLSFSYVLRNEYFVDC
jgi:hypothetical protein